MALKATIYKASINIADMNRHYYADHDVTIARHPSEHDERAMLRLMVWSLHASGELQFTKGISTDDEPDIWQKNLSGEIDTWIELGQPDEKRLRKACGRQRRFISITMADAIRISGGNNIRVKYSDLIICTFIKSLPRVMNWPG